MTAYQRLKYKTLEKENQHNWNMVVIDKVCIIKALGKKQPTSILKAIHPQGVYGIVLGKAWSRDVINQRSQGLGWSWTPESSE